MQIYPRGVPPLLLLVVCILVCALLQTKRPSRNTKWSSDLGSVWKILIIKYFLASCNEHIQCQCVSASKGVKLPFKFLFWEADKESEKTLMKQLRNSAACKEFFLTIFLSIFFFLMQTIVKVFIEFVTILLLLFMFWFLGCRACGILTPRPGIQPALHLGRVGGNGYYAPVGFFPLLFFLAGSLVTNTGC